MAVGSRVYAAHIGILVWCAVYFCIYLYTGTIWIGGWLLLFGLAALVLLQFIVLKRCVLSSIEKRLTGTYVNLNGPFVRAFGLQRYTLHIRILMYVGVVVALAWRADLFRYLHRECFIWPSHLSRSCPPAVSVPKRLLVDIP